MAVPFYLPEGGGNDNNSANSTSSSSGASGTTSSPMSPNTSTSATQTPAQSPLVPDEQLVMAVCEALMRCSMNTAAASNHAFRFPPTSPSCSVMHSPIYTGGDVFFPHARSTPRTPRTPGHPASFVAGGDEVNTMRNPPGVATVSASIAPAGMGMGMGIGGMGMPLQQQTTFSPSMTTTNTSTNTNTTATTNQHQAYHCQQYHHHPTLQYHHAPPYYHYPYTPPLTPSTSGTHTHELPRCYATRRSDRMRLTSTGEEEVEHMTTEPENMWGECDIRLDNVPREQLQEFNGQIPPRKKKKELLKTQKKEKNFTWPAVVTVFFFAMGCGYFVAR